MFPQTVSTDFHFRKREPEQTLSVMVMVALAHRKRRNVESNWRNSSDNSKSSLLWPPKALEGTRSQAEEDPPGVTVLDVVLKLLRGSGL